MSEKTQAGGHAPSVVSISYCQPCTVQSVVLRVCRKQTYPLSPTVGPPESDSRTQGSDSRTLESDRRTLGVRLSDSGVRQSDSGVRQSDPKKKNFFFGPKKKFFFSAKKIFLAENRLV